MIGLLCFVVAVLAAPFISKIRLEAENAALRHQLVVLRRQLKGRARLTNNDRWFFVQLYRWFPSILPALMIDPQRCYVGIGPAFAAVRCAAFRLRAWELEFSNHWRIVGACRACSAMRATARRPDTHTPRRRTWARYPTAGPGQTTDRRQAASNGCSGSLSNRPRTPDMPAALISAEGDLPRVGEGGHAPMMPSM